MAFIRGELKTTDRPNSLDNAYEISLIYGQIMREMEPSRCVMRLDCLTTNYSIII